MNVEHKRKHFKKLLEFRILSDALENCIEIFELKTIYTSTYITTTGSAYHWNCWKCNYCRTYTEAKKYRQNISVQFLMKYPYRCQ